MTEPQGTVLSRRTLIQAAGATAAAYSLVGAAAGTASAKDGPEVADRLVTLTVQHP